MAELINVIAWLWGTKYPERDVQRLHAAVKKNLKREHRFVVFTERYYASPLDVRVIDSTDWKLANRSCFCRLRMFDPDWQTRNEFSGPILSLDLDLVITGQIDPLLDTPSPFMILKGANEVNPNPFNASVMLLRPGHHAEVWRAFSVEKAQQMRYHAFPDDQGWIWHMLPDADGWPVGSQSGIYAFQKPGWPKHSTDLPLDARIVSFIGRRKPSMYATLPWISKYWTSAA